MRNYILIVSWCWIGLTLRAQAPSNWLKTMAQNKGFKQATYGFQVVEIKTNTILADYQSHVALIPASTLKVITTASALNLLGKNYRYTTTLFSKGKYNAATGYLEGDLIIRGSGDPSLQSDYFYNDSNQLCNTWAKAIQEKGLKNISGYIVGDASAFNRQVNSHWIWGDIGNYFGASANGLSFNDNKFSIYFSSGNAGSSVKLNKINPNYETNPMQITNNVMAKGSEDEAYIYGDPLGFTKEVNGYIPPNKTNYEVEASLPDPALLCAEQLCKWLQKNGVQTQLKKVKSNYQKESDSLAITQWVTHASPPLERLVYHTNLKSNNHYAETFLTTIGKGNTSQGISSIKNHWDKRGLDISELYMVDGSGLSRANTVTPNFLCQLLCKMARDSSTYSAFYNSLPIAGKNGSMTNIGKGTFIETNLRAKTGYINRVRSYAGYVKTKSGKMLAFTIIVNNYTCSAKEAKQALEEFMIGLAEL